MDLDAKTTEKPTTFEMPVEPEKVLSRPSISEMESAVIPENETISKSGSTMADAEKQVENTTEVKGFKFALLYGCILLACFLTGYDTSCVATLAPVITDDFHALNNIGWYAIAYLLSMSATLLIFGKLYSFYSMKNLFIGSLSIFVLGSIVTATAPTSSAFIVGRALTGLGSSGMFSGATIIVSNTTSLKHRSIYNAVCGTVECIALAFGPLISGAIAHYAGWRVCFYICIPLGVIIIATVFICVGDLRRPENAQLSGKEKFKRLDLIGMAISVPTTLCFVLGLEWAGTVYAWNDWRIILLLTLAGVLFVSFLFVEYRIGDKSMLPLKMLRQRSVACSCIITFCNVGALSVIAYYIAIYFQAVRGATTLGSGLMYLPLALSMAVAALAGGHITSLIGYANPNLIFGSVLAAIGSGLLTTLTPDTASSKYIGFQILYGIGIGLAFQPSYIAIQAILPNDVVPMGLVTLSFTQIAGGIVVLSIAQNVFFTRLSHNLAAAVPSLEHTDIQNHGAISILKQVPDRYLEEALHAYNATIMNVFYIALALSCLIVVCALGVEWKSVKGKKQDAEKKEAADDQV